MRKIKITVKRMACYADLMAEYENPIEHACDMTLGQVFYADGWKRPEGFCESAWESLSPFVMTLAHGGENFYVQRQIDDRTAVCINQNGHAYRGQSDRRDHK